MHALESSMSVHSELRKQAEEFINQSQRRPGYIIALA